MFKYFSSVLFSSLFIVLLLAVAPQVKGSGPGVLFEDTFTDADNILLEDHNPLWVYYPADFAHVHILNKEAVSDAGSNSIYTIPSVNQQDMCVQTDMIVNPNQPAFIDLFTRYAQAPGQPLVQFWFNGDGTGFTHAYSTNIDVAGDFPTGISNDSHTLTYCEIGNTISWYIDTTQYGEITDPAPIGTGEAGFGMSPSVRFDNFRILNSNPFTAAPSSQITALSPAQVWVGLKNNQGIGGKFDLQAKVYKGNDVIGSGQVESVDAGKSGFAHAHLSSIPLTVTAPISINSGDQLKIEISVRNACVGSQSNGGIARMWYNDAQANTGFGVSIDNIAASYYLLSNSVLSTNVGIGPKLPSDVTVGSPCGQFQSFGTWLVTL